MTMANSLELRVPLLEHKVPEFAESLPTEYKVWGGETKRALKAAFARVLPARVLTRKKAGFPVPYQRLAARPAGRSRQGRAAIRARRRPQLFPAGAGGEPAKDS